VDDLCQWADCVEPAAPAKSRYRPNKYCLEHRHDAFRLSGTIPWKSLAGRDQTPGRRVDRNGYVWIRSFDKGAWVSEHRVVMSESLGRALRKGESVHHINGIRDDNRPENLELWVGPIRYGQRAADIVCRHCGKSYLA